MMAEEGADVSKRLLEVFFSGERLPTAVFASVIVR